MGGFAVKNLKQGVRIISEHSFLITCIIIYVNKLISTKYLSLMAFLICLAIVLFTAPELDKPLFIFVFFFTLFIFLVSFFYLVFKFLGFKKKILTMSFMVSTPLFIVQILATYRSVRFVELLLITLTTFIVIFYVLKNKS
jgi:hypothetical protein